MRLALVSTTHLALQYFQGSHSPPHCHTWRLMLPDQPWNPPRNWSEPLGGPRTLMPLSINRGSWRLLTAFLMLCRLIFQGVEGEKPYLLFPPPPPPPPPNGSVGKSFLFRLNCPIHGEAGKKKIWDCIQRLSEVAANCPGLPIPGLMSHKPWGGEDPLRNPPPPPRTEEQGPPPPAL